MAENKVYTREIIEAFNILSEAGEGTWPEGEGSAAEGGKRQPCPEGSFILHLQQLPAVLCEAAPGRPSLLRHKNGA